MSLHKIFQTGSTLALTVATLVSPLTAINALANPIPDRALAQITEPPPAATPTPSPTPSPAAPAAPEAAPQAAPAPRADVPGLIERVEYINACRQTNRSVEVFADTALSPVNRIGTLAANAEVTLTGVLAPGRAQIIRRESPNGEILVVGWINSAYLKNCGDTPTAKACYRVNVPNLTVRSGPSSTSEYRGTISSGSIVYATTTPPTERTSPNTPPDNGRIWTQVFVTNNVVWIARTGPNGVGNNAIRLPESECN